MSVDKTKYSFQSITILGDGSWGTAMALLLKDRCRVVLWSAFEEQAKAMRENNENKCFLPNFPLDGIEIVSDCQLAIKDAEAVFFVIPSRYLREKAMVFADLLKMRQKQLAEQKKDFPIISLTKGLEDETWLRPSQIIEQSLSLKTKEVMALSGPSHAEEVAKSMPTILTLAGENSQKLFLVQEFLSSEKFRVYTHTDIIGVEIGAAIKNVVAIAAGICVGLGFGSNTLAALITRGLKEMERFACLFGAKGQTLYGLSGVGDLIVTCCSDQSRNHSLGLAIAKGKTLKQYLSTTSMISEGAEAVRSIYSYAKKNNVYMPITNMVYKVLYENFSLKEAVSQLMVSSKKNEFI